MVREVVNYPHEYRDSMGNEVCERLECGRDQDDPIHTSYELRLNFSFLAHQHRGIEGHPTWACNGCGAVVAEKFLELHFKACPSLPTPREGAV